MQPAVLTEQPCPDCFAAAGQNCYSFCPNRYEPPDDLPGDDPDE